MANILVCDDERSICELLDIALRRDGHKIETVNSGDMAKRKIDGALYESHTSDTDTLQTYTPPTSGRGQDWVLVLEGVK